MKSMLLHEVTSDMAHQQNREELGAGLQAIVRHWNDLIDSTSRSTS
ncbi:MAG: hypothetical protein ACLQBD_09890 [Syntrophobacteraceae bacterium]